MRRNSLQKLFGPSRLEIALGLFGLGFFALIYGTIAVFACIVGGPLLALAWAVALSFGVAHIASKP